MLLDLLRSRLTCVHGLLKEESVVSVAREFPIELSGVMMGLDGFGSGGGRTTLPSMVGTLDGAPPGCCKRSRPRAVSRRLGAGGGRLETPWLEFPFDLFLFFLGGILR